MNTTKEMTQEEIKDTLKTAQESVRSFKYAFPGTPTRNLKEYRSAKKMVAQLLTRMKKI